MHGLGLVKVPIDPLFGQRKLVAQEVEQHHYISLLQHLRPVDFLPAVGLLQKAGHVPVFQHINFLQFHKSFELMQQLSFSRQSYFRCNHLPVLELALGDSQLKEHTLTRRGLFEQFHQLRSLLEVPLDEGVCVVVVVYALFVLVGANDLLNFIPVSIGIVGNSAGPEPSR